MRLKAMTGLLLAALSCACGVASDPHVAACEPPPEGFSAARSGDFVRVDRRLDSSPRPGGIRLFSEGRVVESVPGEVDFGDVLLEVRADMTLCLLLREDG